MALDQSARNLDDVVSKRAAERLRAFGRAAEDLFPGQVTSVILFGSRARGDARANSDYDVAVLLRDLQEPRAATHRLLKASYAPLLAGYHINPVALPADFLSQRLPQTLNISIARDGLLIRRRANRAWWIPPRRDTQPNLGRRLSA